MGKVFGGILSLFVSLAAQAAAQPGGQAVPALSNELFERGLEHALENPKRFDGEMAQEFPGQAGPRCHFGSKIKLNWGGDLQEVHVDLDERGSTDVALTLAASTVQAEGLSRDGLLCTWGGGRGKVDLGRIFVHFKLVPSAEDRFPTVDMKEFSFADLQFNDFRIGLPGMFWLVGEAPEWLEDWIETNLNAVIVQFLASNLKSRLDAYLTRELAKQLDRFRGARSVPVTHFSDTISFH